MTGRKLDIDDNVAKFLAAYLDDLSQECGDQPDPSMHVTDVERVEDGYWLDYSWTRGDGIKRNSDMVVTDLQLMAFAWRGSRPA